MEIMTIRDQISSFSVKVSHIENTLEVMRFYVEYGKKTEAEIDYLGGITHILQEYTENLKDALNALDSELSSC